MQVKANNKMKLAQYMEQAYGVSVNPASMFDIQVISSIFSGLKMLIFRLLLLAIVGHHFMFFYYPSSNR